MAGFEISHIYVFDGPLFQKLTFSTIFPFPGENATLSSESNHAIESAVSENMGNDTKINSLSLILPELPGGHLPPPPRCRYT